MERSAADIAYDISEYIRRLEEKSADQKNKHRNHQRLAIFLLFVGILTVFLLPYGIAKVDNWAIPSTEIKGIKNKIHSNENTIRELRRSMHPFLVSEVSINDFEINWLRRSNRNSLIVELTSQGVVELNIDEILKSGTVRISDSDFLAKVSDQNRKFNASSYKAGPLVDIFVSNLSGDKFEVMTRRPSDLLWHGRVIGLPKANRIKDIVMSGNKIFIMMQSQYIFRSDDLGKNWFLETLEKNEKIYFKDFFVDEDCNLAVLRTDRSVSYSSDCGKTWGVIVAPIDENESLSFGETTPDGVALIVCDDGYLYAFDLAKGKWSTIGNSTLIDYNRYNGIFFGSDGVGVLLHDDFWPIVSTNNGQSWSLSQGENWDGEAPHSVEFYGEGVAFVFSREGEIVAISNDGGVNWGRPNGIPLIKRISSASSNGGYSVIFGADNDALIFRPDSNGLIYTSVSIEKMFPRDVVFSSDSAGFFISDGKLYEFEIFSDSYMQKLSDSQLADFESKSNSTRFQSPISNLLSARQSLEESLSLRTRLEQSDNKKYIEKIVLRSLIVTIFAYFIGVLINNARYAMKLSVFYDSVASSVRLAQSLSDDPVSVQDLVKIINVCMPSIEYGKQLKLSAQEMLRINQMRFG